MKDEVTQRFSVMNPHDLTILCEALKELLLDKTPFLVDYQGTEVYVRTGGELLDMITLA